MLSERIKAATKNGHQNLEKQVVYRLKAIENNSDYADLLKFFFSYFETLEQQIANNIPASLESYFSVRRSAKDIAKDIAVLGADLADLPQAFLPVIENKNQAIGALYVLEGATLGGQVLRREMAQRLDLDADNGGAFLNVYGAETGRRWKDFLDYLGRLPLDAPAKERAVNAARSTFSCFEQWLDSQEVLL